MLPITRDLLFTDLDGNPVDEVEDVINGAADEPGYFARIPALETVLTSPGIPPYDRFLAVSALAAWGTESGLRAVEAAALAPDDVLWSGVSIDRRYSVDDTFTLLAESVYGGADYVESRGTNETWLAAVRALVRIASKVFYDWQLTYLFDAKTVPLIKADMEAAIRAGLGNFASVRFPLGPQLADVATGLATVDEELGVDYGYQIAAIDASLGTLRHLVNIVSRGSGESSAKFGDYLATQGGEAMTEILVSALADRQKRRAKRLES